MHGALAAEEQRALDELRIPTGPDGQPMDAQVDVSQDERGHFTYRVHFGRRQMGWWVGPEYDYPREAQAFADQVNRRAREGCLSSV